MNNRGMVLITVLWIVLVIAFISFSLAAATRVEVEAVQQSFAGERAFFMAKSAAEVTFRSLKEPSTFSDSPVQRENGIYIFPFDSGEARVHFESDAGAFNINTADDKLLASMFDSLGIDELHRNQLVDSILDWRDTDDVPHLNGAEISDYGQVIQGPHRLPRNSGFESVEELLLVKYMTPEIFYGHIEFDPSVNAHRRIPGVRDLVNLTSERSAIDVNQAPVDVLFALPKMNRALAARIVSERMQKPFGSVLDIEARLPELQNSETLDYMTTDAGPATSVVSVATVRPSGASRTVRLVFSRTRKKQIILEVPLIYKDVEIIQSVRWQY
jgi:general secretion pathway protein K